MVKGSFLHQLNFNGKIVGENDDDSQFFLFVTHFCNIP
jgi:hypothetical protein